MQALVSAGASLKQAKTQGNVAAQMEGRANVLKIEIKQDSGRDTSAKEAELTKMQQKAESARAAQTDTLAEANRTLAEAAETSGKDIVEAEETSGTDAAEAGAVKGADTGKAGSAEATDAAKPDTAEKKASRETNSAGADTAAADAVKSPAGRADPEKAETGKGAGTGLHPALRKHVDIRM